MKNKMTDLRNHLFEVLEMIKDTEAWLDLNRVRAIAEISARIVETAKVEVAFIAETGASGSEFFENERPALEHRPRHLGLVKQEAV